MPTNILSSVFGRSPVGTVQTHIAKVHQCALQLSPFFQATFENDWKKAETLQADITDLEHQADAIKKKVRQSLPKSLFLPVSRSVLLEIVTVQDKVANRARDIAGIVLGRQMIIPDEMKEAFLKYLDQSIATSAQAVKVIDELNVLIDTGFSVREIHIVEELVERLDRIESIADKHEVKMRKLLFSLEKSLHPVDVFFLYKIIDWVGDLADRASRVGGYFQLLLAR